MDSMRAFVLRLCDWAKRYEIEIILTIGVVLISLLSFAVGYLVAKEQLKEPIRIENTSYEKGSDKEQ